MKRFLSALGIALLASVAFSAPIRVLIVTGGEYHDFTNTKILEWLLLPTGDFSFTTTQDLEKLTNLSGYDAVFFYTQGRDLTKAQEKGLTDFVRSGKGYVGVHCASDSFKSSDKYWELVGGRFVSHGREVFKVSMIQNGPVQQILQGVSDFAIEDETYVNEKHKKAYVQAIAKRDKDGEAAAWIQQYGKGRVFYTGLGHGREAWSNEGFQRMVANALYWVCNRVPSGGNYDKALWGFRPLFNGATLEGWAAPSDKWTVKEGVIDCAGGGGGWLRTNEEFADFELHYEYRIGKGGNSGAFFRATKDGDPAFTGHEIQILDDNGKAPDKHSTGALYDAWQPSANPSKPAWEWNTVTIRMMGRQLTVTQNGIRLMNINLDDPVMNQPLSEERKMWARAKTGFIGFQDHGAHVQLRNIAISVPTPMPVK